MPGMVLCLYRNVIMVYFQWLVFFLGAFYLLGLKIHSHDFIQIL